MCPEIFGIDSYALMCAIGLAAACTFVIMRRERLANTVGNIAWPIVSALVGLVIGAKLLFFITRIPALAAMHATFDMYIKELVEAGYVFYGGVLGAYAGLLVFCRITWAPSGHVLNFFTPAFALFHGFGRIGCFCAGCCYGVEVKVHGIVMNGVQRLPVQLFESIFEFLMFAGLLIVERQTEKKKKSPKLSFYYLMIYSLFRFSIEFVRGDEIRGFWGPLSTSQWIALIILVAGLVKYFVRDRLLSRVAE
ncbi:MAG: prolipoprotein diacylglyceryl transferase [Lachnospiraceae bacterium]|nr:prolipoprotein diacylglyceryl transferase [Lachnospiraceae bacterium]